MRQYTIAVSNTVTPKGQLSSINDKWKIVFDNKGHKPGVMSIAHNYKKHYRRVQVFCGSNFGKLIADL